MPQKNKSPQQGFTFVELMIVITIIAAMTAVAVPLFSGTFRESSIRAAARSLAAKLSYAHRQSIIQGKAVRVAFDTTDNLSWLEIETRPGEFEFDQSSLNTKQKLPEDASFLKISGPETEPDARTAYSTFFPDGTADQRQILIQDRNKNIYEITVHPATGVVATKQL
jgi:type II secretion system protein H